jgi:hypothetical protein
MRPKIHIISAHANGDIDPTVKGNILCRLPGLVDSQDSADVILVPVSWYNDFRFNQALWSTCKPVVIMDFMEIYGTQKPSSHIFGQAHGDGWNYWLDHNRGHPAHDGYDKFHRWVAARQPALQFVRELREVDRSEQFVPIEWPCYLPAWQIEGRAAFNLRPFEVLFNWGMSNRWRPLLHSSIYRLMGEGKIDVIGHWDHVDAKINEPHKKWISIHTPHTNRIHINDIARRQAQSKLTVSMPGSGVACFRSTEALVHTVPVKLIDDKAWSFDWVDGYNCLVLKPQPEAMSIGESLELLTHKDLHPIYRAAQDLADRYRSSRYINEYIMPHIERCLP